MPFSRTSALLLSYLQMLLVALPTGALPQETSQPAADAGLPAYTLRTSSNLVILDVVVSGPDGRPIHGLLAKDFAVSEDGKPQQVRNFQEHTLQAAGPEGATAAAPKLSPGLFTNFTPIRRDGPANVLLLDMLNTPLRDQAYARMQIQQYLDHAPAGTEIAIFGLSNRLTILRASLPILGF